jgi:hypothetical protein
MFEYVVVAVGAQFWRRKWGRWSLFQQDDVGFSMGPAAHPPTRLVRPIDLRACPIRVKRALTDCPW